ncbi:hypothetical protein K523DRAFT_216189, partial [Schizophyllum commune Tattone D]
MSDDVKELLMKFWKWIQYLIIDEYSMIAKSLLAILSRNVSIAKGRNPNEGSFGSVSERLYHPTKAADAAAMAAGRAIYEEFTTVVVLRQQMRVTDTVWHGFLQRLRYGQNTPDDRDMLDDMTPYLITPRHAVRRQWNEAALRQHCASKKERIFICMVEQTTGGRPLSLWERHVVASSRAEGGGGRGKGQLPLEVEIAIGAKVLVTRNLETDLDITNGARGEIVGIVLSADEPDYGDATVVRLHKLPLYVLVQMERTRA